MAPRRRILVDIDWADHLSVRETHQGLAQRIPGGPFDRLLALTPDVQAEHRGSVLAPLCPYCAEALSLPFYRSNIDAMPPKGNQVSPFAVQIETCAACGYWRQRSRDGAFGTDWVLPWARSFQPATQVPALRALAAEADINADRLRSLTPRSFELFVGSILRDHFDCQVIHVGGTGDGGVDLVVLLSDDPLLVQVKRRLTPEGAEGVDVVKNLFASVFAAGQHRGMLVTTANRFTRGATEWMRQPTVTRSKITLELVDVNRLLDMTRRRAEPSEPAWHQAAERLGLRRMRTDPSGFHLSSHGRELVVQWDDRVYTFNRADRDSCLVKDLVSRSKGEEESCDVDHLNILDGFAFDDLLEGWPGDIVDRLVDYWAGTDKSDLVEVDF